MFMQSVKIDSVCSTMIKTNTKSIKNITCTYKDNVVQMTFYALQDLIGGRRE